MVPEESARDAYNKAIEKIARLDLELITIADPIRRFEIEEERDRVLKHCSEILKKIDDGLYKLLASAQSAPETISELSNIEQSKIDSTDVPGKPQQMTEQAITKNPASSDLDNSIENIYKILVTFPPLDSIRIYVLRDLFKQIRSYHADTSLNSEMNLLRFSESLIKGSSFLRKITYLQGFTQLSEKDKLVVALAYTNQEVYLSPKFCNQLGVLTEANIRSGIRHAKRKFDETLSQD